MKHQKFNTYQEASQNVATEEALRIESQIAYIGWKEAKRQLNRYQKDSLSWHVIEGKLYYLIQCDIKIMHRLDLGCTALHDGPFFRLNWFDTDQDTVDLIDKMIAKDPSLPLIPAEVGSTAFLCGDEKTAKIAKLSRETKARKYYAQQNWIMTTESSLYFDQCKQNENTPTYKEMLTTSAIKEVAK
tara:strand:- start:525 stop:1082 length:558 start_codon:yes stop_codon:yes gene_type:complete